LPITTLTVDSTNAVDLQGVADRAPSTYHDHVANRIDPFRPSARAKRDGVLKDEVRRVLDANFRVYGVRKVWRQLQREGFCTVARLMKAMGLDGFIRGKSIRIKVSDKAAPCPWDPVNRQFHAPRPNMLWFFDFTSRPGPASSMSPSSSTPMPVGSSAGG
jgi:putative transposase